MPHDAKTDHGTVLKPDEAALIVEPSGELRLAFPKYDDDESVPRMVVWLTALTVKSRDEEWVDEIIAEFEMRHEA